MIEQLLLEVLDAPTEKRIVIETDLPVFDDVDNNLYYMIDRSPDQGDTTSDKWHVSTNVDSLRTFDTHKEVLSLAKKIMAAANEADIRIESFWDMELTDQEIKSLARGYAEKNYNTRGGVGIMADKRARITLWCYLQK